MATPLNTIKNWFKTGLKPTQTQFWAMFDSFWHKAEEIPTSSINGLDDTLDNKVDKASYDIEQQDVADALVTIGEDVSGKVDKVDGKGLSTNDFTDEAEQTVTDAEAHLNNNDIHVTADQKKTYANKLKAYVAGEVIEDVLGDVFRISDNKIYSLNAALPYTTNDIIAETVNGDWTIELEAPEAGLTIKDADGIDQFSGSFALFEGFGFDPATKKIISIPLSAFKVFIDSDNGDDSSAQISDPFKPFKTDAQAMAALPVDGNVWDFELTGTSSHVLTAPYMSRHIRIISKTKSIIDLSAYNNINFSATPFYLDAPFSTVIQSGGIGYTQTTVQDLFLRCASYVSTNENHCFATSKINSLISIGEVTTKGHAFHGGSIKIGQYNCGNGMLLRSQSNEKNVDLKIKEVITNGTVNVGFIGGATMAKRPYEIVTNTTGSNFISTSSIRDFNLTGLRCNSGCVLTTSTISVISGVVSSYFLGSIKPTAGAKFKNFTGRLLPVSGGDSYGITYDISDSTIYLDNFLCAGLAQFEHPDRVFKFSNVLFIQDNPQDLIQNFNDQTLIEVQKSGFIKSNGTLGDAAPNVTLTDITPNIF